MRYIQAQDEAALDTLADNMVDALLDGLDALNPFSESAVDEALLSNGVRAEQVQETSVTASQSMTTHALGGVILKSIWHLLLHPFRALGTAVTSNRFRVAMKGAFRRGLRKEYRATRHLVDVAGRLARAEEVNSQERKAALHQLVGILTKVAVVYFVGPQVLTLFTGPMWKGLSSLTPPLEIVAVLLDRPLRAAARKLLSADLQSFA